MSPVLSAAITFALVMLGLALLLAFAQLLRGPSAQDRVLAFDLMSVLGLLAVLLLSIRYGSSLYLEAALLMALLGFVSSGALAKFLLRGEVIE
ncbi:MAG: K+/H+ antiporter subunit F [Burkholderiaceae bacterium]|jgi:multicomponent K+:H+ antiporter subunit F|nr:K+/H+ antiporter subunit F [Burkholderiaceae bacterium]